MGREQRVRAVGTVSEHSTVIATGLSPPVWSLTLAGLARHPQAHGRCRGGAAQHVIMAT
jgi:hypothetical protein